MVVGALAPVVEKVIVDRVIDGHQGSIGPWLALLLVIGAIGFASAYVRRFVGGRVALDVQYDLRNAIYERLQRLDLGSHDQLPHRPARVAGPVPTSACCRACSRSCRSPRATSSRSSCRWS